MIPKLMTETMISVGIMYRKRRTMKLSMTLGVYKKKRGSCKSCPNSPSFRLKLADHPVPHHVRILLPQALRETERPSKRAEFGGVLEVLVQGVPVDNIYCEDIP